MQVDFYHLTRMPLERVLPRICERVAGDAGRLLIVSGDEPLAARIDAVLWTYAEESFLPHGRDGAGDEAHQPILIAAGTDAAANGARFVALVDGVWRDEALGFERAFYFFDADTIDGARAAWRSVKARAGVVANYHRQDEAGRWQKVDSSV